MRTAPHSCSKDSPIVKQLKTTTSSTAVENATGSTGTPVPPPRVGIDRWYRNRSKEDNCCQIVALSRTVTQVRKFPRFTNYYRIFLYRHAQIAKPFNQLISGDNAKHKKTKVVWTKEFEKTFQNLKEFFSNAPCLAYPDYTS